MAIFATWSLNRLSQNSNRFTFDSTEQKPFCKSHNLCVISDKLFISLNIRLKKMIDKIGDILSKSTNWKFLYKNGLSFLKKISSPFSISPLNFKHFFKPPTYLGYIYQYTYQYLSLEKERIFDLKSVRKIIRYLKPRNCFNL